MNKQIISCICLTCGIRNDHTEPHGFCQNGHDNWLEYRDVINKNEHFKKALKITGLSAEEFTDVFMNNNIKQIKIIH